MDYADESSDKSPATKDVCNSDPVLFCPALDDDDANSLYDGASPADGELNYDATAFPHFYACTNWFAYESDANYPTSKTLEYDLTWDGGNTNWDTLGECSSSSNGGNNNNNNGGGVPGDNVNIGSDTEEESSISSGAKTTLWVILSLFMVACVAAAGYFGYHWYMKHQTELGQSMTKDQGDAEAGPVAMGNDDGNTLETGTTTM